MRISFKLDLVVEMAASKKGISKWNVFKQLYKIFLFCFIFESQNHFYLSVRIEDFILKF